MRTSASCGVRLSGRWWRESSVVDVDLVLARVATIDRCLARIAHARDARGATLAAVDADDILLLNLERATQAVIDLANHVVASEGLGLPDSAAAAFSLLEE